MGAGAIKRLVRGMTPIQRKLTKSGAIHGDFTMATVNALQRKGLFHLVIDSPNGQCGFMRLTELGQAVQAALKAEGLGMVNPINIQPDKGGE